MKHSNTHFLTSPDYIRKEYTFLFNKDATTRILGEMLHSSGNNSYIQCTNHYLLSGVPEVNGHDPVDDHDVRVHVQVQEVQVNLR